MKFEMAQRGPLQRQYLQVHPAATTGLDLCAFFAKRIRTAPSPTPSSRRQ